MSRRRATLAISGMPRVRDLTDEIARLARRSTLTVGVAESLTGGQISSALAAGPDAVVWFRGAVVAYAPGVKFGLLGVTPGPVNTARCALEMARGLPMRLGADVAVSATGVGGPGKDEGVPPGTVFIACADRDHQAVSVAEHHLDGTPAEVLARTVELALEALARTLLTVGLRADTEEDEHPGSHP